MAAAAPPAGEAGGRGGRTASVRSTAGSGRPSFAASMSRSAAFATLAGTAIPASTVVEIATPSRSRGSAATSVPKP